MSREKFSNPFAPPAPKVPERSRVEVTSTVLGKAAAKQMAGFMRRTTRRKEVARGGTESAHLYIDDAEMSAYKAEKERIDQMVDHLYEMNQKMMWIPRNQEALKLARLLHSSQIDVGRFLEQSDMWGTAGGGFGVEMVRAQELLRIAALADLNRREEAVNAWSDYEKQGYEVRSDDMRYHTVAVLIRLGDVFHARELCEQISNFDQRVTARIDFIKVLAASGGRRSEVEREIEKLYAQIRDKNDYNKEEEQAILYAEVFATQCELGYASKDQLTRMDAYVSRGQRSSSVRLSGRLLLSMSSAALNFQEMELAKKYLERLTPQDGELFGEMCAKLIRLMRDQGRQSEAKIFIEEFKDRMVHFGDGDREGAYLGWKARLYAELGDLEEARRLFDLMSACRTPEYVSLFTEAVLAARLSDRLHHREK